jgi:hypothetical protein
MKTKLEIHGHPIYSSQALRAVIDDMRKTFDSPSMVLDMHTWTTMYHDRICYACAGASAVIHGMDGSKDSGKWTDTEWEVARFFERVRVGKWQQLLDDHGWYCPLSVRLARSPRMEEVGDNPEEFFDAWYEFADALEASEKGVAK